MFLLLQEELGRAEDRLRCQGQRHVTRQPRQDTAVGERLDDHHDVAGPAAAQAGDRVQQMFGQAESLAHGVEEPVDQGDVFRRG